jgi:peptidylprolyl isomerase
MTKTNQEPIKVYSKETSYKVGEKIRHEVFEDVGIVQQKEHCAGEYQKIIVKFSKVGKKTLIEKKGARKAKLGDQIAIRYEATLDNGEVVDASHRKKLTLGKKKLFASVEKQMVGMREGEAKSISLPPEKAYGLYYEGLVTTVSKRTIDDEEPKVGDRKFIRKKDGSLLQARITCIQNNTVILDANHPYAGNSITYDIELIKFLDEY